MAIVELLELPITCSQLLTLLLLMPDDLFNLYIAQLPARALITCIDSSAAATAANVSQGSHAQVFLINQAVCLNLLRMV